MSPNHVIHVSDVVTDYKVTFNTIPKAKPEYSSGSKPAAHRAFRSPCRNRPNFNPSRAALSVPGAQSQLSGRLSERGRSSGAGESSVLTNMARAIKIPGCPLQVIYVRPLSKRQGLQSGGRPGCGSRPAHRCGAPGGHTQCTAAAREKAASASAPATCECAAAGERSSAPT